LAITIDRALIPPSTSQINRQRGSSLCILCLPDRSRVWSHVEGPAKIGTRESEFRHVEPFVGVMAYPGHRRLFCSTAAGKTWTPATADAAKRQTRQKFAMDALDYPTAGQVIMGIAR
jgi:hypothetical protein